MRFQGTVLREQGVTFAVVIVKRHVLDNQLQAAAAVRSFQPFFRGLPVLLMGQDPWGRATYFGRPDIARFMASVPVNAVPWKEYTAA